jgi:hypothetical protein
MTVPDQHTAYVAEEHGVDLALRFHLTTRVFPYWSERDVEIALPALNAALDAANEHDWDRDITWTYTRGHETTTMTAHRIIEGLNLWALLSDDDEEV